MSDRYQDPNWGKHGNPNRTDWFQSSRGLNDLTPKHWSTTRPDRPLFHDGTDTKVSVWTIVWVIAFYCVITSVGVRVKLKNRFLRVFQKRLLRRCNLWSNK
jgi:hypothetical protein